MQWLKENKTAFLKLVEKHGFSQSHVGMCSALGLGFESADLMVLVTRTSNNRGLLGLVELEDDLTYLLGIHVEASTERMIPERDRERVLNMLTSIIAST